MEEKEEIEVEDNQKKSSNFKFIVKACATSLIIIILGLYFISQLFEENKSLKKIDLSQTVGKIAPLAVPPLSPNQIKVYFTTDGRTLTPELREFKEKLPTTELSKFILSELSKGPKQGYFEPVIPSETEIRGVYLVKDQLVVDFSKILIEKFDGGLTSELLAVYAIVNSIILNCEGVESVKILVDGKTEDVFHKYIDISSQLSENLAIISW